MERTNTIIEEFLRECHFYSLTREWTFCRHNGTVKGTVSIRNLWTQAEPLQISGTWKNTLPEALASAILEYFEQKKILLERNPSDSLWFPQQSHTYYRPDENYFLSNNKILFEN